MTPEPEASQKGPLAFLDANVLVPIAMTDTLLTLAEVDQLNPQWSPRVLDEVSRTVSRLEPAANVQHRINQMNSRFPRANITGGQQLAEHLSLPDPDDRHVVASAIHGSAEVIVTNNLKDFPAEALPAGLLAQSPDEFLLRQYDRRPEITIAVLHEIAQRRTRPPITTEQHLEALKRCDAQLFTMTARGELWQATRTLGPEFDGASVAERINARISRSIPPPPPTTYRTPGRDL